MDTISLNVSGDFGLSRKTAVYGSKKLEKFLEPLDRVAIGIDITGTSNKGGYTQKSGTSMSCPLVAGMALLLKQAAPKAAPAEIKAAIMSTAMDLKGLPANHQGAGVIKIEAAFDKITGYCATATLPPPPQQINDTVATGEENRACTDEKKWTILFYGAGDNDLAQAMFQEVNQLESVGSSSAVNIVAQLDLPDEDKGCCKTYFIKKGTDPEAISSPVVQELGSVNMADPKVLSDFIAFGIKKYPAEHYMLVIADHGKGWRGAISDMSHNGWMTVPQKRL